MTQQLNDSTTEWLNNWMTQQLNDSTTEWLNNWMTQQLSNHKGGDFVVDGVIYTHNFVKRDNTDNICLMFTKRTVDGKQQRYEDGLDVYFHTNGRIAAIESYNNGRVTGPLVEFHDNSVKTSSVILKDGSYGGGMWTWYRDGRNLGPDTGYRARYNRNSKYPI